VFTGMLDQCASAIGALNIAGGMVTETTGTVLAITSTIDHATPYQKKKMMPYIAHGIPGKYLAITFMTTAGIVLKWFKDNFCYDLIDKAKAENRSVYELLDELVDGTGIKDDIIMLPHFCGCTYPVSNPYAKGMLGGITLDITRADVIRAIYESIAFMLRENLEYFENMGIKTTEIVSLGGGARSSAWLKIKSDVLKKPIVTLNNEESTTLGAAAAAAVFAGYLSNFSELSEVISIKNKIKPDMSGDSYEKKYSKYLEFYSCVKDLYR
jgi:xylulokinase